MKRNRYSEEQIVRILREVESGQSMAETSRKYGVHEQTIYRWRAKYEGMEISDVRKMKALEEENRRLKRIVAQQTLDNYALKDLLSKKW
jgi:putative transposase